MIYGCNGSFDDRCSKMVDESFRAFVNRTSVGSQVEFINTATQKLPFGKRELALCFVKFEKQTIMSVYFFGLNFSTISLSLNRKGCIGNTMKRFPVLAIIGGLPK